MDKDWNVLYDSFFDVAYGFSGGIALVRNDETTGWFYINKEGEPINRMVFNYARNFSEDRAFATQGGKGYLLNPSGNIICESTEYNVAMPFVEGVSLVQTENFLYYIDRSGRRVFS